LRRRPQLAATLIDVAVVALVISIIAVLLTGAGLVYAHQQASAAKAQARLLKDQQLDLRTPVFEAEIEDRGSPCPPRRAAPVDGGGERRGLRGT
jgi:hypothetical protein